LVSHPAPLRPRRPPGWRWSRTALVCVLAAAEALPDGPFGPSQDGRDGRSQPHVPRGELL